MYYTAYGLVNSPEPRVQPLLPDVTPRRRRRAPTPPPRSPARAFATAARDSPPRKSRPKSAFATAARERTPSPSRRRRPTSAPVKRNDAAASERARARWSSVKVKIKTITALAQQRRSVRSLVKGPAHRTYVPDAKTRRRLLELEADGAGDAWDATLKCYCFAHVRGKGATDDPQHWVVYIVRDAREGASAKADAAARALRGAPWPQRVRVLDGVRPPPSLCGACVAADCGGAPCRDHARPGLQKETMATVAAPGAFDVYAVKLPSAGCVPPCPRCGASAGHAALPQSAPRLYRLASRFADGGRFPSSKRCARALRAAAVREGGCDGDAARAAAAVGAYACAGTENDEASVAAFCRARAALRAAPGAASAALVAAWRAAGYSEDDAVFVEAAARAADHAAAASKVRAAPPAARFAERCGPSPRRRRAPADIIEPVGVVFLE